MITAQKRSEIEREYSRSLEAVVHECTTFDRMSAAAISKMLGIDVDDVARIKNALGYVLENERAQKPKARPGNGGKKPLKQFLWDGKRVTFDDISSMTGIKKSTVMKKLLKAGIRENLSHIPDWLFTKLSSGMNQTLEKVDFAEVVTKKVTERQWICLYIEFWRQARGAKDTVPIASIECLPEVAKNWCKQYGAHHENMRLSYSVDSLGYCRDSIILYDVFGVIPQLRMHK